MSNASYGAHLFFKGAFDKIRVTHTGMSNRVTVQTIDKKFEALRRPVQRKVLDILAALKKEHVAIDVLLLGNRQMRTLNRNYRGKDAPTNVLSFEEPKKFTYPDDGMLRKGEIYLNPEMSSDWWLERNKKRAEDFLGLDFLLVHGVLHLFGYDHIKNNDAVKMERKEAALMKHFKNL